MEHTPTPPWKLYYYLISICLGLTACHKHINQLATTPMGDQYVVDGQFKAWSQDNQVITATEMSDSNASYWKNHVKGTMRVSIAKEKDGSDNILHYIILDMTPLSVVEPRYAVIQQFYTDVQSFAGKTVTLSAKIKSSYPGVQISLGINKGIYKSQPHPGTGQWQTLHVSANIPSDITQMYIQLGFDKVHGINGVDTDDPVVGADFFVSDVIGDIE